MRRVGAEFDSWIVKRAEMKVSKKKPEKLVPPQNQSARVISV
jgi:hypothetical protein